MMINIIFVNGSVQNSFDMQIWSIEEIASVCNQKSIALSLKSTLAVILLQAINFIAVDQKAPKFKWY